MNLTGLLIGAVVGAIIGFLIVMYGRRGQKN